MQNRGREGPSWWVWLGAVAAALALVLLVAPGLVLRGPVFAWAVDRVSRRLCGTISVARGEVEWLWVPRLLLGAPVHVQATGLEVHAPDGELVLSARRLALDVSPSLRRREVVLHQALVEEGQWRVISRGRGEPVGLFRAFLPLASNPPGCLQARPPSADTPRGGGAAPERPDPRWRVRGQWISLRQMASELSFRPWGLTLGPASSLGHFTFTWMQGRPRMFFEVRQIQTNEGGVLRLGPPEHRRRVRILFDDVSIARVAVTDDAPDDIRLQVASARTGPAHLAGTAVFVDALARPPPGQPYGGLRLDARWSRFAEILPRILESSGIAFAPDLSGDLEASLRGPYRDLLGHFAFAGERLRARVKLLPGDEMAVALRLRGLPTQSLLPDAIEARWGGLLEGHVALRLKVPSPPGPELGARLESARITYRRPRHAVGPPTVVVTAGDAAADAPRAPHATWISLEEAVVEEGALRLNQVSLGAPGLRARGGALSFALWESGHRFVFPNGALQARWPRLRLDLARLAPHAGLRGDLQLGLRLRGDLQQLAMKVNLRGGRTLHWGHEGFRLPARLSLSLVQAKRLELERVRVEHLPRGAIEAWGHIEAGGDVNTHFVLSRYPLSQLAKRAAGTMPSEAPLARHVKALAQTVRGRVAAFVHLWGTWQTLRARGQVALSAVRVGGEDLGDGGLSISPIPAADGASGIEVQGRLVQALGLHARLTLGRRPGFRVALDGRDFPVGALQPGPLPVGFRDLQVSGPLDVRLEPAGRLRVLADLVLRGEAANVRVRVNEARRLTLQGRVFTAPLARIASPAFRVSGLLALQLEAPLRVDAIDVSAVEAEVKAELPVTVSSPWLPLSLTLASGSRVRLREGVLALHDVIVRSRMGRLRLAGTVALNGQHALRSRLALTLDADVDAATLRLWLPAIERVSGRLDLRAHVGGTPLRPQLDTALTLAGVTLSMPSLKPLRGLRLEGRVYGREGRVLTRGLTLSAGSGGHLVLGSDEQPAFVELGTLWRPTLQRLDVPITGVGLQTFRPLGGVSFRGLDLDLRLQGGPEAGYLLRGHADVERAFLRPRGRAQARGPLTRVPTRDAAPNLELDVILKGRGRALEVPLPVLPDVNVGFRCHLQGQLPTLRAQGRVKGAGAYSAFMVWLYDLFSARDIRRCDLTGQASLDDPSASPSVGSTRTLRTARTETSTGTSTTPRPAASLAPR